MTTQYNHHFPELQENRATLAAQRRATVQAGNDAVGVIQAAQSKLPGLLREREAFRQTHQNFLAPAGRSAQIELDAEMELLALLPDLDVTGTKAMSQAARDRELRKLKIEDRPYLAARRSCQEAANELANLDLEIECLKGSLSANKAILHWLTALLQIEEEE